MKKTILVGILLLLNKATYAQKPAFEKGHFYLGVGAINEAIQGDEGHIYGSATVEYGITNKVGLKTGFSYNDNFMRRFVPIAAHYYLLSPQSKFRVGVGAVANYRYSEKSQNLSRIPAITTFGISVSPRLMLTKRLGINADVQFHPKKKLRNWSDATMNETLYLGTSLIFKF